MRNHLREIYNYKKDVISTAGSHQVSTQPSVPRAAQWRADFPKMFFNYAEEAEKRREERRRYSEGGLDPPSSAGGSSSALDTGGAGSGSTSSTRYTQSLAAPSLTGSVASSSTRRVPSVPAWESRTDGNARRSAKSEGRSSYTASLRPAWPPSHAEIVADARSDQHAGGGHSFFETDADIITGPKIPMWYRGPLLLSGKLELPQPLTKAYSAKAFKSTSGIPAPSNGMMGSGYDGVSDDVGTGVRAARERARSVSGIPTFVDDDSSASGTWVSDDHQSLGGEGRRTYGEGSLVGVPDRPAAQFQV